MLRATILGAVLLAGAAPASAAVVTATYEGTVVEGFDGLGEFGIPERALDGLGFVAEVVFDTSRGLREFDGADILFGVGPFSPILSVSLAIDGARQAASGADFALLVAEQSVAYIALLAGGAALPDGFSFSFGITLAAVGADVPAFLDVPTTLLSEEDVGSAFFIDLFDPDGMFLGAAEGVLDVDRLTVTVAAVPLPAGGLLLLSALGGAALLAGRKRA